MYVRGGAPGTRETDLLDPVNLVEKVHAVVLAGGSAFGLDAASGVMQYLREKKIGFPVGSVKVPIVPAAILYDLGIGRADVWPDAAMGYRAAASASAVPPDEGNAGAGTGASVGKIRGNKYAMKAGLGTWSIDLDGLLIGALAAVNAVGDVVDPNTRTIKVRAWVDNASHKLKPEMFARLHIDISEGKEFISVPKEAVLEIDGKEFVYMAQADGTYLKQEVKVGSASDDHLRILRGLKLGDRVVTKGAILLKGNESKG